MVVSLIRVTIVAVVTAASGSLPQLSVGSRVAYFSQPFGGGSLHMRPRWHVR